MGYILGDQYTKVATYVDQYSNVIYALILIALVAVFIYLIVRSRKRQKAGYVRTAHSEDPR